MSVGGVYARALFTVLKDKGASAQDFAKVESELSSLDQAFGSNRELKLALSGNVGTADARDAIVADLAKKAAVSEPVSKLMTLVSRRGRWAQLGEIGKAFSQICLEAGGGVLGLVESADPMEDRDISELQESFGRKLGKKVQFQVRVNPALIAGVRITVGGVTYDGTVRSNLQRFKNILSASATAH